MRTRDVNRFFKLETKRDSCSLSVSEELEYAKLQDDIKDIMAWILIEA